MQEKYNKKLLTMKMLKTQKRVQIKKGRSMAVSGQFHGRLSGSLAVSMAIKKKRAAKQFHRPPKQKHNYKSNDCMIVSSRSM